MEKELNIKAFLYAGTTEGRLVASMLTRRGIETYCFVATKSGEEVLTDSSLLHISVGRQSQEDMKKRILELAPNLIIDATHPYAVEVSNNIYEAARQTGTKLIRVVRECFYSEGEDQAYGFDCLDDLIDWLNSDDNKNLKIFSTLGAKEVRALTGINDYKKRLIVRILPATESINLCKDAGLDDSNILAKMPPFTAGDNEEMFGSSGCGIMITKDTGIAGGFAEKMDAARKLGLKVGIIKRPKENSDVIKMDMQQISDYIQQL